ncbi:hypothetical protein SLA2020_225230 [Shorea laevis]
MACSQSPFYQKLFEGTEGKSNGNGGLGAAKCIQKSSPKPNAEIIMFTGPIKLPARSHFCCLLRPTAKNTCPGLLFVCLLVKFYYEGWVLYAPRQLAGPLTLVEGIPDSQV